MPNNYIILKDNYTYSSEGIREFSELTIPQYFDLVDTGAIHQHQSVDLAPTPDELVTLACKAKRFGYSSWFAGYEKLGKVYLTSLYIDKASHPEIREQFFKLANGAFVVEDGNDNGDTYLFLRWLHPHNNLPPHPIQRLLAGAWDLLSA